MKLMVKKFNEFVNEYFHYDYKDAPSTSDERPAESRFNMLPKGLKNELPRSLKDALMDSDPAKWDALDSILSKLEKLMGKKDIHWKSLPGINKVSAIKNIDQFVNWLRNCHSHLAELEN